MTSFFFQLSETLLKTDFPDVYKQLKGIISIDKLPNKIKKAQFLIINQSESGKIGSHWLVLSRDLSGSYEVNWVNYQSQGVCSPELSW